MNYSDYYNMRNYYDSYSDNYSDYSNMRNYCSAKLIHYTTVSFLNAIFVFAA